LNEGIGKVHFWLTFIGVYAIFMPMHYIGLGGHLRRYPDTTAVQFLAQFDPVHWFMSVAAFITIGAQLLFVFNLVWSLVRGEKTVSDNPWEATTLEWTVPSPPPHDNFAGLEPVVHRGPYEFAVPGADKDYTPQHLPEVRVAPAHGDD
jgi:cytochrome c oxidase subunit 1